MDPNTLHTHVLPIQYSNGDILMEYLGRKFGFNRCTAIASRPFSDPADTKLTPFKMRNNSWTVGVPKRLTQAEIDHLNEEMRRHYYTGQ
ncbi:hypothetical protein ACHAPT_006686 [Fusarium lateritium]